MKFIKNVCGLRIYLDDKGGAIGLNTGNTSSSEPWYVIADWRDFCNEVNELIKKHREETIAEQLSSIDTADLMSELDRRRESY